MKTGNPFNSKKQTSGPTLRDLVAIGFRQKRVIVFCFLGISAIVLSYSLLRTRYYQSTMKILVKQERVAQRITSDEKAPPDLRREVSEQELSSEVELLKSRDLLRRVVLDLGLHELRQESRWSILKNRIKLWIYGPTSKDTGIAQAAFGLRRKLDVELLKKSSLIRVAYDSPDPELAARVLEVLAAHYLERHLAVHRSPGTFSFFQQEAEQYRAELAKAQDHLLNLAQKEQVVSPQLEKDMILRNLTQLESALQVTQADIAATTKRIQALEKQALATPARMLTAQRKSSGRLSETLQETLANLELKRIELAKVFQPGYPLVRQIEKQLEATRAAITSAQQSQMVEETTDRDPAYDLLRTELARARSDLAALQAREAATRRTLRADREKARRLDRIEMVQLDLERDAKLAEQNYLVYSRKREEARISDALDQQHIMNVAVAEAPTVPFRPSDPRTLWILLGGEILALLISGLWAFVADYWDRSFRTPGEVEEFLNVPVAASVPNHLE